MSKFQDYLKNIFWIIVILQFTPPLFKSIKKQWTDHVEPKNKVGLIHLNSTIMSSTGWNQKLTKFFKDPEIKAILLKIDSPGGAAGSAQAICQEILNLKKEYPKPIVTYAENICASGAYYIAATTDYIVATNSALIGSIGSKIATQFKLKEFAQNYKVQPYTVSSGSYKNALDPFVDMTDDQKKMMQELVDDSYDQFANDIAKYRHLNVAQKNLWGEGKIFTGNEALGLKLIDETGNQTVALNYIKKQILHADREIELIKIQGPSKFQKFFNPDADEDTDDIDNSIGNCIAQSIWQGLSHASNKQGLMF